MLKSGKFLLAALLFLVSACSKEDENVSQSDLMIFAEQSTELRQAYKLEIADTKEKMYHGLMGRTSLDENTGFLFDVSLVPQDMDVAMWMKDTLIPLDMVFIDENGKVFYIHENAQPNDETPIYPPKRPRIVLEVNGGQVAKYSIKVGDTIKTGLLNNL